MLKQMHVLNKKRIRHFLRPKIDKGLHEIKGFWTTNETISRTNRQPTGWEKIFTSIHMTVNWYLECIRNYKISLRNKEKTAQLTNVLINKQFLKD